MSSSVNVAKNLMDMEIKGISELKNSLDTNFVDAINIIFNCQGKIVVSGMGKSGHIASKMAATFSSTGTTSIFVHPAEASHGDLGMIDNQDVVIALSNSGETTELFNIISYCTRFNIPLIAMTRNPTSSLATEANITLAIPETPEACPLKLAPTTSTTQALVLGDALAIALLEKRGFTSHDFHKFHPGGKLGQQLLTVDALMHSGEEIPLVHKSASLTDAISIISEKKFGCVGLIDDDSALCGILTDGDLRRLLQTDNISETLAKPSASIMSKSPITLGKSALASKALAIMEQHKISNVFITDEKLHVVGIVHLQDCLKAGVI